MDKTPKSLRLQIGIVGRTNVGKSSFLNMIAGQDVSITSVLAGTTTDVVEKTMELLPLGPVVFLDTAAWMIHLSLVKSAWNAPCGPLTVRTLSYWSSSLMNGERRKKNVSN